MNRTLSAYIFLEFKKCFLVLTKSVIGLVLALAIMGTGIIVTSYTMMKTQVINKITVALAIPQEEKQTKLIAKFISSLKSVSGICEVSYTSEETAKEMVQRGEAQAAIVFPESFYNDMYYGKNTPCTVYLAEDDNISTELFNELLVSGIGDVKIIESFIYANITEANINGSLTDKDQIGNYYINIFIKGLVTRTRIYNQQICSPIGNLNYVQYYFVSAIILALLIGGLYFGCLYREENHDMEEHLRIFGIGNMTQAIVKISVMSVLLWIFAVLVLVAGIIISKCTGFNAIGTRFSSFPGIFVLCFSFSCFFNMIYTIFGKSSYGTIILLLIEIVMVSCSGLIIPLSYMPDTISKFKSIILVNGWMEYGLNLLFGSVTMNNLIFIFISIIMCLIVGVSVKWKNY